VSAITSTRRQPRSVEAHTAGDRTSLVERLRQAEKESIARLQFRPAVAALGLMAVATLALPGYWVSLLSLSLVYSLVALSLVLLTGYVGQISLAQGSLLGISAFTTATLVEIHSLPFGLAMAVAVAVSVGLGVVVGLPALRLQGLALAIATWSFALFAERYVLRQGWLAGGQRGRSIAPPKIGFLDFGSDRTMFLLVAGFFFVLLVLVRNVVRGRTGHALVAVRDSEAGAQAMGINITRYKLLAFALSAGIAGVAGGLHAILVPTLSVNDYNQFVSITMLAIAMIGGIESLFGAVLAGLAFIALPQLLRDLGLSLTGSWFDLVLGLGLLFVVVSRPEGLASILPARRREP
jgi:branched-chain amino acid transport system permease protein